MKLVNSDGKEVSTPLRYAVSSPAVNTYRIVLTDGVNIMDICGCVNYAVAMTTADLLNRMRGYTK